MNLELLEARRLLISPEIDLTFGSGGFATLANDFDGFSIVRALPDGDIIAAGPGRVVRLNADGTPDASFDGDGVLEVDAGDTALAPGGKFIMSSNTRLLRYNADGTPDASFGTNGVSAVVGRGVYAVQPDGRIVVLTFTDGQFFPKRVNANGSIDNTFAGRNTAIPMPGEMNIRQMVAAPDGRIYFLGALDPVFNEQDMVGRLNADGTIDTSFSGDGFVRVVDDPDVARTRLSVISVDPQGRVVVNSQRPRFEDNTISPTQAITRFTTSGNRDATFGGGDGWAELPDFKGTFGKPLAFGPEGKITVALAQVGGNLSLFRLNGDGTIDTNFGTGGIVPSVRKTFVPDAVALDAAGNILVAGQAREPASLQVTRFVPDSVDVHLRGEGTLFVTGTDGNDTIALERVGSQITLRRNGVATTFAATAVTKLTGWGFGGDDAFSVSFALDADLIGSTGDDVFTLGHGNVTINAGDGNDVIVAGNGQHVIDAGDSQFLAGGSFGANRVTVGSGIDSITTGHGNDTITSGDGADFIEAFGGDDAIVTGSGNDTIYTGDGNDEVAAGAGNDTVQGFPSRFPPDDPFGSGPTFYPPDDGGEGRKLYYGEDGNDILVGGVQPRVGHLSSNFLFGGNGNDELWGNPGDDFMVGGDGDDFAAGGRGDDTLYGNDGGDVLLGRGPFDDPPDATDRDWIDGAGGVDTIEGGDADDVLDTDFPGLTLDDGLLSFVGTDVDEQVSIWLDSRRGVIVWIDGEARSFSISSFSSRVDRIVLSGGGGNDLLKLSRTLNRPATLDGGTGSDSLYGGAFGDVLRGGDGDDYLFGFGGDDFLDGGLGGDELSGGDGRDSLDYSTRTANLIIGLDDLRDDGEAGELDLVLPDIERVFGGAGDDIIGGGPGLSLIYGGPGDDTLSGGAGADALYGAAGNDRFDGGLGDDYIEGGAGDDTLFGGEGADLLFGLSGNDVLLSAGDATRDTVRGGPGADAGDVEEIDDVLSVESV